MRHAILRIGDFVEVKIVKPAEMVCWGGEVMRMQFAFKIVNDIDLCLFQDVAVKHRK